MISGYKNILKGKSSEQIEKDLKHLHPVDYFCMQFQYLFHKNQYNSPSYDDVIKIANQIDDYRLRFTARSEMPQSGGGLEGLYGMFRQEPTHYIDVTYETTFDKFERTIMICGHQIQVSGTNHISSGFGEAQPPPNW